MHTSNRSNTRVLVCFRGNIGRSSSFIEYVGHRWWFDSRCTGARWCAFLGINTHRGRIIMWDGSLIQNSKSNEYFVLVLSEYDIRRSEVYSCRPTLVKMQSAIVLYILKHYYCISIGWSTYFFHKRFWFFKGRRIRRYSLNKCALFLRNSVQKHVNKLPVSHAQSCLRLCTIRCVTGAISYKSKWLHTFLMLLLSTFRVYQSI